MITSYFKNNSTSFPIRPQSFFSGSLLFPLPAQASTKLTPLLFFSSSSSTSLDLHFSMSPSLPSPLFSRIQSTLSVSRVKGLHWSPSINPGLIIRRRHLLWKRQQEKETRTQELRANFPVPADSLWVLLLIWNVGTSYYGLEIRSIVRPGPRSLSKEKKNPFRFLIWSMTRPFYTSRNPFCLMRGCHCASLGFWLSSLSQQRMLTSHPRGEDVLCLRSRCQKGQNSGTPFLLWHTFLQNSSLQPINGDSWENWKLIYFLKTYYIFWWAT